MALKTFVKISSVNNLSDARYCAGMYVDLIGFDLESHSDSYIKPESFIEITNWISGPALVGEFDSYSPEAMLKTAANYPSLDYLQVSNEQYIPEIINSGYKLILKKTVDSSQNLRALETLAKYLGNQGIFLLLDSNHSQTLSEDMATVLRNLASNCKILLGYGFNAENVVDILDKTMVEGISMKGGQEIKPGLRDFDELADILEVLEID